MTQDAQEPATTQPQPDNNGSRPPAGNGGDGVRTLPRRMDNEPHTPLWRNPVLFPIAATIALFVAVSFSTPLTFTRFMAMSPEDKVTTLERFFDSSDGYDSASNMKAQLRAIKNDNPQIILAAAKDPDPEVRAAGLKALESLLIMMRSAVDFDTLTMPNISPPMQAGIDEIVLTGIREPQGEHFDAYKKAINQLMTEGDRYHTAAIEVIDASDDDLLKAQMWLNLFFTLGPQADAKPFILQALNADSSPKVIGFATNLAQGLLDPDFIEPLTAIATNTELPHAPRHHALTALACYGAQAQSALPLLQGLPQEEGWKDEEDEDGDDYCREDAARSIREIEAGTPRRTIYLTRPDGTPWRNINPLW